MPGRSCSPTLGLSEMEREWSARSRSSYCGYSPVQRSVTGSFSLATVAAQTSHHQRTVSPKSLFDDCSMALGRSSSCQLRALRPFITHLSLRSVFSPSYSISSRYHSCPRIHRPHKLHRQHLYCLWRTKHAPTCAYRLVLLPIAHFGYTISREHVFVAGVVVETIGPLSPNTARGLLNNFSTASDRKMQIADHVRRAHNVSNSHRNSIPNPNHPYQHHCERCCDYHPVRSHSTAVMALFVFVIVQPP